MDSAKRTVDAGSIEVVDAGIDFRYLSFAVLGGMSLLVSLLLFGRDHGALLIETIGALIAVAGLVEVVHSLSCSRARQEGVSIQRVWIETFRRPGYAGVIPRYRVKALAVDDAAPIALFPFARDNYFEDLSAAKSVALDASDARHCFQNALGRRFLIKQISRERYGEAVALLVAGALLMGIGHYVRLLLGH